MLEKQMNAMAKHDSIMVPKNDAKKYYQA